MTRQPLGARYRAYIDCLNARDWDALGTFVDAGVVHNGRPLGLAGYRAMLAQDVAAIPDLRFEIALLVVDHAKVAARLRFDCHPAGTFLGLAVNGRRVLFHENVFYALANGRIVEVWSVIDRQEIEEALRSDA